MYDFTTYYQYKYPMFAITVSTVIIYENMVLLKDIGNKDIGNKFRFPTDYVKAGIETIQFAALRTIKEQTCINISKDKIIPVDFRSEPERSISKNVVDFGFVSVANEINEKTLEVFNIKMIPVDFENCIVMKDIIIEKDHDILLERALKAVAIVKEDIL